MYQDITRLDAWLDGAVTAPTLDEVGIPRADARSGC